MSFFFKKEKKPTAPGASPTANRERPGPGPQITPQSSVNNSLNSLGPGEQGRPRPDQEQSVGTLPLNLTDVNCL
jgi:hypothetical protein